MRDDKGRFGAGNNFGRGRPVGSGKQHVKEMTWGALERVVKLLFTMPEAELVQWIKDNQGDLSRAEKVFLETKTTKDLKHLNHLLDRIIGKPTYAVPDGVGSDDELAEALAILEAEESGEEFDDAQEQEEEEEKVLAASEKKKSNSQFIKDKQKQHLNAIKHKEKMKAKRRQQRKLGKESKNVRRKK